VGDVLDPDSLYHHLQRYVAFLEVRSYSLNTIRYRDTHLRTFIIWCDERSLTRPGQLDRLTLERYQRHLFYYRKANGDPLASESQQQQHLWALRLWLRWMVKQGQLSRSPAEELELPRSSQRLPKAILTARKTEAVLAQPDLGAAVGLRNRAILETLYSTGMGRAEVCGLQTQDLDFERGMVMIRQGKGKKDRLIPIGERALAWIAAYRERARGELVAGRDLGRLFLSCLGENMRPAHLTRVVGRYVREVGVGKLGSCHMFRHTMATLMMENGADIRFIQAMLGHVNLNTTQLYTQVSLGHLKEVHTALHPGRLPEAARRALEAHAEPEPSAGDRPSALDREASEESET
jgi:integrase/recombinase XerD